MCGREERGWVDIVVVRETATTLMSFATRRVPEDELTP